MQVYNNSNIIMSFFSSLYKTIKNKINSCLSNDPLPSIQRPRERVLKPVGYGFKTIEIIQMINKIEESQKVNEEVLVDFLEEIPFASNYRIDEIKSESEGLKKRKVGDIYDRNYPSYTHTCIGEHTQILGLTEKCMISLSKHQYEQLQAMMKQCQ